MPRPRQRGASTPDPYAIDLPEVEAGDLNFEEGLPDRRPPRSRAEKRSRRSYNPEARLGNGHARGDAGSRYRGEGLDFEAGLPAVRLEKSAVASSPPPLPLSVVTTTPDLTQPPPAPPPVAKALRSVKVGDRVYVDPKNAHDEMASGPGTVAEIGGPAIGIEFDSMPDEVHRWYVAEELDKVPAKAKKTRKASVPDGGPVPKVLTWEAVRGGDLPELGNPGMAPSLAQDVPPEYRFWKCETKAAALRVREALVEANLFTEETIQVVNGELRRVEIEPVVKLYLPPIYDDSTPPRVPPEMRPVEKAAALLIDAPRLATLFGEDVVEAVGIETVLDRVKKLAGDWVLAAKDTPEVRKVIGGPAFRLRSRADLVFATNAELSDPSAVEWVTHSREEEVLKHAFRSGRTIRLLKAKEQRIVFGVVLEPDEVDAQNDTISAEEIEQAAHKFMEEFQNLGVQHKEIVNGRLKLLENFIAPVPFEVNGETVKAGTWLMKQRVVDDALWKAVKAGEFTGFSIGGSAIRKPTK